MSVQSGREKLVQGQKSNTEQNSIDFYNLICYASNVKHLPLNKQLQGAPKFVSTNHWILARDEFKFSRCFDRLTDLASLQTPILGLTSQLCPELERYSTNSSYHQWSQLLMDVAQQAIVFDQIHLWKRSMAAILAHQAAAVVQSKQSVGKRIRTCKDTSHHLSLNSESIHFITTGQDNSNVLDLQLSTKSDASPDSRQCSRSAPISGLDALAWEPQEDVLLLRLMSICGPTSCNTIANVINSLYYNSRPIRTFASVQTRHAFLATNLSTSQTTLSHAQTKHIAARHLERFMLMKSATTKLIAPVKRPGLQALQKKITSNPHPSHDAAARKATQNISKLVTPMELALRRLQRTMPTASGGAISTSRIGSDSIGAPSIQMVGNFPPANHQIVSGPSNFGTPRPSNFPDISRSVVNASPSYQAAISAAVARQQMQHGSAGANVLPATTQQPTPAMMLAYQQRQALLNRSQQIGSYIANLQSSTRQPSPSNESSTSSGNPNSKSIGTLTPSKINKSTSKDNSPSKSTPSSRKR